MFWSTNRRKRGETIERLYGAIVAQAREPEFYRELAVPDTLEGRFDLLALHVHLVFRRLATAGEASAKIGQQLFDYFIDDMDAGLREIGVGDLAVPKRMRAMGEAFYGRAVAYDGALASADGAWLVAALLRNVYSNANGASSSAAQLADYVRRTISALEAQGTHSLMEGQIEFPHPEGSSA